MARKKKRDYSSGGGAGWLVTFSDLVTLLLTFFVLLLSMASMDTAVLTRISHFTAGSHIDEKEAAGKISERVQEVIEMLRDPENVFEKQDRIKDLLFPDDLLPPEIKAGDLKENLSILEHPEGVVIVLTDSLLFAPGSATLDDNGLRLIELLTPVILAMNTDVNIGGYADAGRGTSAGNDDLSAFRAIAVLDQFLQGHMQPDRFSISGYGVDRPLFPSTSAANRQKNRRVEILLKTDKRLGKYI